MIDWFRQEKTSTLISDKKANVLLMWHSSIRDIENQKSKSFLAIYGKKYIFLTKDEQKVEHRTIFKTHALAKLATAEGIELWSISV